MKLALGQICSSPLINIVGIFGAQTICQFAPISPRIVTHDSSAFVHTCNSFPTQSPISSGGGEGHETSSPLKRHSKKKINQHHCIVTGAVNRYVKIAEK